MCSWCGALTHPAHSHVVVALLQVQRLQQLLHHLGKPTHTNTLFFMFFFFFNLIQDELDEFKERLGFFKAAFLTEWFQGTAKTLRPS